MPCNQDGCDIHDFPIASPWCAFKWHQERQGRATQDMANTAKHLNDVTEALKEIIEDLPFRPVRPSRPLPRIKEDPEKPQNPYRGVRL